jgi:hypothetical protein
MTKQNFKNAVGGFILGSGLLYLFTCTFVKIPKENQRNADTGLIAVIQLITMVAAASYRTNNTEVDKGKSGES